MNANVNLSGNDQPLLKAEHLSLTLKSPAGAVSILKDIDLEIGAGETVSIVGPSGSGKTSLLMLLAGLETVTSGDLHILEKNLRQMNEDELAAFRCGQIGIVFQNFHLVPTMTALENVALPLELAGISDPYGKAERVLRDVGLEHRLSHFPGQLSGGEQQRVGLARAIAPEPALLLADEPTGNLDQKTGNVIADLLFDLAQKCGTTVMLITHDPALAERCSRTLEMRAGRLTETAA